MNKLKTGGQRNLQVNMPWIFAQNLMAENQLVISLNQTLLQAKPR